MHVNIPGLIIIIRYKLILYKDVGTRLGLNAKIWVKGGKGNGQTGAGRRAYYMMIPSSMVVSATIFHKKTNRKMTSVVLRFNKKTTKTNLYKKKTTFFSTFKKK